MSGILEDLVKQLWDGRFFITALDCVRHPEVGYLLQYWQDNGFNYWSRAEFELDGWVAPAPERD